MSASALCGREGPLLSVSISVDPRHLESLLEALAQLTFPINPQIYHDAALIYRFPDEPKRRSQHFGRVPGIRGAAPSRSRRLGGLRLRSSKACTSPACWTRSTPSIP